MPCEGKAMRVLERTDQGLIRFLAQNFHGMTEKKIMKNLKQYIR